MASKRLHRPGIEPGPPAWQASILPLNQRCLHNVSNKAGLKSKMSFLVDKGHVITECLKKLCPELYTIVYIV